MKTPIIVLTYFSPPLVRKRQLFLESLGFAFLSDTFFFFLYLFLLHHSQFGEYNPGGGKDEVLKYLNESKKQVVIAEKCLKKIMECLDIEP